MAWTCEPKVDEMLQCLAEIGAVLWFPEEGLRSAAPGHPRRGQGLRGPLTITKVICQHVGTDLDATQHFLPVHEKMKKKFREEFGVMVTTGVITHRLLAGLMPEDIVVDTYHTPVVIQLMIKFGLLVPLQKAEGDAKGRAIDTNVPRSTFLHCATIETMERNSTSRHSKV